MEHTVRMAVIPEDQYLSLLNQKRILANPLESHIVDGSNRLNEILHAPNIGDTAKFQLYMDELKRVQKARSDREEQPMNINIKSVSGNLLEDLSGAIEKKITRNEQFKTPKKRRKRSESTDYHTPDSEDDDKNKTEGTPTTSNTPRTIRKENFDKLYKYLNENRAKFGIREDGKIFKDHGNKIVHTYSNFEKIARSLTGLTPNRPHGLRDLLNKIKDDDFAKKLIVINVTSPQLGKGNAANVIVEDASGRKRSRPDKCPTKKEKRARYRPEIWNAL